MASSPRLSTSHSFHHILLSTTSLVKTAASKMKAEVHMFRESDSDTERDEYTPYDYECVYINTLLSILPMSLAKDLKWIIDKCDYHEEFHEALDRLIRFISGGPHFAYADGEMRSEKDTEKQWKPRQAQFRAAIREVHKTAPKGRFVPKPEEAHGIEVPSTSNTKAKRRKIGDKPSADDTPIFTLHSVSTTSPIRKKMDITIHKSSIQFTNPATHEFEASVPIQHLKRSFILPSHETAKPQWKVVLTSTDYVEPQKKKGKISSSEDSIPPGVRVIFKMEKNPTTKFETTDHISSSPPTRTVHKRTSDTLPQIESFLAHFPTPPTIPSHDAFPSVSAKNRESGTMGTLWLTKNFSILWDENRSCEFWAMKDISDVRCPTTHTFHSPLVLCISRKNSGDGAPDRETQFTLPIEKRYRVDDWIRHRNSQIWNQRKLQKVKRKSKAIAAADRSQGKGKEKQVVDPSRSTPGESLTINNIMLEDNDDEDDEDFVMDSDDDSASSSSGELSECVSDEGCDMSMDEGNLADVEPEGGTKKAIEPTPEHPPLQPGASMPKEPHDTANTAATMIEDIEMGPPVEESEPRDEESVLSKKRNEGNCDNNGDGQDSHVTDISLPPAEQNEASVSQGEGEDEIEEEIDELDD